LRNDAPQRRLRDALTAKKWLRHEVDYEIVDGKIVPTEGLLKQHPRRGWGILQAVEAKEGLLITAEFTDRTRMYALLPALWKPFRNHRLRISGGKGSGSLLPDQRRSNTGRPVLVSVVRHRPVLPATGTERDQVLPIAVRQRQGRTTDHGAGQQDEPGTSRFLLSGDDIQYGNWRPAFLRLLPERC
jgi:hypothetical protein